MLYYSAIVLLGRINPAIFHPQWLDRYKIVPAQDVQSAQGEKPESEELPFKDGKLVISKVPPLLTTSEIAELNFPKFKMSINRQKYICSTLDRQSFSLIKDVTIKIFNLLSHTPIKAAGINFDAHLGFERDVEDILKEFFAANPESISKIFGTDYFVEGTIKFRKIGDVDTINFDKSDKFENSIFVHANYHKNIETESVDEAMNWVSDYHTKAISNFTKTVIDLLGEPKNIWTPQQQKK